MLLLEERVGVRCTHVPFRGEADGTQALLGGHVDMLAGGSGVGRIVDEGKALWLNIWSARGSGRWPDVPTPVKLGYRDMVITSPYSLVGPAGMDPTVTRRLHGSFVERAAVQHRRAERTGRDRAQPLGCGNSNP